MILKAKHNFIIYPFFKRYSIWLIKRNFCSIRVIGDFQEKNLPVLLISNHMSWWDGFWAMYLNVKILKRKFHFMMLEEQLRKHFLFNYSGGFSINKKKRSVIESLNYTADLLNNSKNMVLVFPQGEIQTMHNQNFQFEKGVERILKDKAEKVHIVFMINLIDYFSSSKPGVYIYIQEYNDSIMDLGNIQNKYNEFHKKCIKNQKILNN